MTAQCASKRQDGPFMPVTPRVVKVPSFSMALPWQDPVQSTDNVTGLCVSTPRPYSSSDWTIDLSVMFYYLRRFHELPRACRKNIPALVLPYNAQGLPASSSGTLQIGCSAMIVSPDKPMGGGRQLLTAIRSAKPADECRC
jgi:hypothetical protein